MKGTPKDPPGQCTCLRDDDEEPAADCPQHSGSSRYARVTLLQLQGAVIGAVIGLLIQLLLR
jgi:hypothetical protein